MPLIRVTPSYLYHAAQHCRKQAESLRMLVHSLSRKIYSLETVGQQSKALNPVLEKWLSVRRRCLLAVAALEDLGALLELNARNFEEADHFGAASIMAIQPQVAFVASASSAWWAEEGAVVSFPPEHLQNWEELQIPGVWEKTPLPITSLTSIRDALEGSDG